MRYATILGVAVLAGIGAAVAVAQRPAPAPAAGQPTVEVYKSPTCGCCSKWVDHLRASGFTVRTTDTDQVDPIKNQHGVPMTLRSCHTAVVDGYVLEGHVPATSDPLSSPTCSSRLLMPSRSSATWRATSSRVPWPGASRHGSGRGSPTTGASTPSPIGIRPSRTCGACSCPSMDTTRA